MIRCFAWIPLVGAPFITSVRFTSPPSIRIFASRSCASSSSSSTVAASRRSISLSIIGVTSSVFSSIWFSSPALSEFSEIPNSGGVKGLDLRIGDGDVPIEGDQIAIHYYGRLAAKQGWRFDSTYDHKDNTGEAVPFTFILGCSKVIPGIETAVRSMKVGGIRRVIIPPSQGYQNTSQEPLPPNRYPGPHRSGSRLAPWVYPKAPQVGPLSPAMPKCKFPGGQDRDSSRLSLIQHVSPMDKVLLLER